MSSICKPEDRGGTFAALFKLKAPCGNCPFLREGALPLRDGRVEDIARTLVLDDYSTFSCHKTLPHQRKTKGPEAHCAGALIYLEKAKRPSVWMRLAASTGIYDAQTMRASWDRIIEPFKAPRRLLRNRDKPR